MKTEKQIQNSILRKYGTKAMMRLFRQNTGGAVQNGRFVQFGVKGQNDLGGLITVVDIDECGCCGNKQWHKPIGQHLGIEVKNKTGRPSQEQANYQRWMLDCYGINFIARSLKDVDDMLDPIIDKYESWSSGLAPKQDGLVEKHAEIDLTRHELSTLDAALSGCFASIKETLETDKNMDTIKFFIRRIKGISEAILKIS